MRLAEKVALVTGSSSGIGRAIALQFAQEGADLVLCDLQPDSRLEEEQPTTEEAVVLQGRQALFVTCDVSNPQAVDQAVTRALARFGRIDVLVNSAGIFIRNGVEAVSDSEWDRVIGVNLKGCFHTCRRVLPEMARQGRGKVVNISSIHGILGTGEAATYCASKGGVENLTRQLAFDYARQSINVNAVSPGTIITAMSKPFRENPVFLEEYKRRTLLPRLGYPQDVAYAAAFLASHEADFITGHSLVVDGGWTIA